MILDGKKLLDAERLQLSAKALVQTDGRLTFSTGAVKMLDLPTPAEFDRDKPYTLLIYDLGDKNPTRRSSDLSCWIYRPRTCSRARACSVRRGNRGRCV